MTSPTEMPASADAELLARFRAGDAAALEPLFARYASALAGRPGHSTLSFLSSRDTELFDRSRLAIKPLGYADPYAPRVGFADGWPVAYSPKAGWADFTHCYGYVGVGRDLSPDTGTGGELYAVIGHAPRHLDRNIAIVGRVIEGIDRLSSLPRGTEALGFYKDKAQYAPIARLRLASQMPPAERPSYEYLNTASAAFATYVKVRANRHDDFYIRPAGGVDVCNVQVPVRKKA